MRKNDFAFTKEKVEEYSAELTYMKNHQEFADGFNVSIYHHDIQILEAAISQISKTFKNKVEKLNDSTLSKCSPKFNNNKSLMKARKHSSLIPEKPTNLPPHSSRKPTNNLKQKNLSPTPNIILPIIDHQKPSKNVKKPKIRHLNQNTSLFIPTLPSFPSSPITKPTLPPP